MSAGGKAAGLYRSYVHAKAVTSRCDHLTMADVRIGVLGRIVAGQESGRVVEVIDDTQRTGGWLICTYADLDRSPEAFDSWVASRDAVDRFLAESGWEIDWGDR